MLKFDLRFPPEVRAALLALVEHLADAPEVRAAARHRPPSDLDPDLADIWQEALGERSDGDLDALRDLLATPHFGESEVHLPEAATLAALRGFSQARLAIRTKLLASLSDERLEVGDIDRRKLSPGTRHAYACYNALGEIQAVLCEMLDS